MIWAIQIAGHKNRYVRLLFARLLGSGLMHLILLLDFEVDKCYVTGYSLFSENTELRP